MICSLQKKKVKKKKKKERISIVKVNMICFDVH